MLKPLRNRVLIKRDTPEERTAGGIVIPEVCKDPPTTGTVLAVGPGRVTRYGVRLPMSVEEGDRVMFPRWSGNNVTVRGKTYLLVPEDDIIARI